MTTLEPWGMVLAATLIVVFVALAATHVYWALGGRRGSAAAVPSVDGRPLFTPSRGATLGVAAALVAAAVVIAGVQEWIAIPVPAMAVRGATFAIALLFALRAVGNFRSVGFFKRPSNSAFASRDTLVYSPLCLGIAVAALVVWWSR